MEVFKFEKIIINNMSFTYDNPIKEIFNSITLELDMNWKTIIVGKNGRGKSTLLNIIRGELEPNQGYVKSPSRFVYFPFDVSNEEERVMNLIKDQLGAYREYEDKIEKLLAEGTEEDLIEYGYVEEKFRLIDGYNIENLIRKELKKIGLDEEILDRNFASLSGGEKNRVKLIILFLKKEYFPLIDEPTNHLDIDGREAVAKYLSSKNKGFICISHDRVFLELVGDHILYIHSKRGVEVKKEKYESYYKNLLAKQGNDMRKNIELKNSIKRLEKSAREKMNWGEAKESSKKSSRGRNDSDSRGIDKGYVGHKAAKLMKRGKSIERKIKEEVREKRSLVAFMEKEYDIKFRLDKAKKLPKEILRIENLGIRYEEKKIIDNLSFSVNSGERVAIVGKNGSGKSFIIKAILGKLKDIEGLVYTNPRIEKSYIEQELSYREESLENYLENMKVDIKVFGTFLAALDMRGEVLSRSMLDFSQGEKRKVALALSLFSTSNFFIWDEPLNFLDLELRIKLEDAIMKYKPTMIFVEHDMSFVERVATKIIKI